jgi:predicted trehalose synthase
VKIIHSPMPDFRAGAVAKVNARYNAMAAANLHRDQAHAWKRSASAAILAGDEAPAEFAAEASAIGMTVAEFAAVIASKPNEAALRELLRQAELRAIAAAQSPDELGGLLK